MKLAFPDLVSSQSVINPSCHVLCEEYTLAFDKNAFDEVSLEIIKDALLKHQDARIKYFLANTYLVPELK